MSHMTISTVNEPSEPFVVQENRLFYCTDGGFFRYDWSNVVVDRAMKRVYIYWKGIPEPRTLMGQDALKFLTITRSKDAALFDTTLN